MAYSDGYMKEGKWVELPSTFCDAELFGKAAERTAAIKKGTEVFISGKLKSQQWTTQEGQKRSKVLIAANTVREIVSVRRESAQVQDEPTGEDIPF